MVTTISPQNNRVINALAQAPHHIVLILDDEEFITNPSIHDAISLLIRHLPPQVHLMLAYESTIPTIVTPHTGKVKGENSTFPVRIIEPEKHREWEEALFEPLSPREQEVLALMAQGASNQKIAETLIISIVTVKSHVSNILSKLHASNRTGAVAQAQYLGLLSYKLA